MAWISLGVFAVAALAAIGALLVGYSHALDSKRLKEVAEFGARGSIEEFEVVRNLTSFVYATKGFAKNSGYFFLRALGPTPLQVLHEGGDCADKSRLLAALLGQLGIRSGLVMIYPRGNCGPIHTVVEAGNGAPRTVADPIWDVVYPVGVRDLAHSSRPREIVDEVKRGRSTTDKVQAMPDDDALFDYAKAINFQKNAVLRTLEHFTRKAGLKTEAMYRPRVLEDPKLAMAALLGALAAIITLFGVVALWWSFGT